MEQRADGTNLATESGGVDLPVPLGTGWVRPLLAESCRSSVCISEQVNQIILLFLLDQQGFYVDFGEHPAMLSSARSPGIAKKLV